MSLAFRIRRFASFCEIDVVSAMPFEVASASWATVAIPVLRSWAAFARPIPGTFETSGILDRLGAYRIATNATAARTARATMKGQPATSASAIGLGGEIG